MKRAEAARYSTRHKGTSFFACLFVSLVLPMSSDRCVPFLNDSAPGGGDNQAQGKMRDTFVPHLFFLLLVLYFFFFFISANLVSATKRKENGGISVFPALSLPALLLPPGPSAARNCS